LNPVDDFRVHPSLHDVIVRLGVPHEQHFHRCSTQPCKPVSSNGSSLQLRIRKDVL
jgi:hypothetical protein